MQVFERVGSGSSLLYPSVANRKRGTPLAGRFLETGNHGRTALDEIATDLG